MSLPSLPIETRRLSLRPFRADDFEAYRDYHVRPEVYRFLYAAPAGAEEARAAFTAATLPTFAKDGDVMRLAVSRRTDNALLGEVLLKLASMSALQAEVGYIFNPDFNGQGYATEAVGALVDAGFATLGMHRIFARLDADNRGSIGVVERLRFRREAHLIQNDRFNDVWGDEFIYAVLAAEWARR
ncbi:GNAT family N-acetyltransferase [Brevundimonas diminuta]|uniref:GNAT family N-acetyltransferase n=1 Tax=Brevundimonas diminuta TaxID=293 RepID=UPI003207E663